jgi:hypothetical protein
VGPRSPRDRLGERPTLPSSGRAMRGIHHVAHPRTSGDRADASDPRRSRGFAPRQPTASSPRKGISSSTSTARARAAFDWRSRPARPQDLWTLRCETARRAVAPGDTTPSRSSKRSTLSGWHCRCCTCFNGGAMTGEIQVYGTDWCGLTYRVRRYSITRLTCPVLRFNSSQCGHDSAMARRSDDENARS